MIGILGRGDDPCIEAVVAAAGAAGIAYVLIDEDQLDSTLVLGRAHLRGVFGVIDLETLSGVYARPLGPCETSGRNGVRATGVATQLHHWLDVTQVPCLGRPRTMASNSSKPYQAQLIAGHGLAVPNTLVTNDPDAVRAFRAQHGRVIYKSISGIRSIVRELDEDAMARLERVRDLPTQFQAWVPGDDVRVHVVGRRAFATRISTDALDYRYAASDGQVARHEAIDLEPAVADACIGLAASLELPLAGIDLRIGDDGAVTCFEANPMPAFSYFEAHTGQPIAAAIANLLERGCREPDHNRQPDHNERLVRRQVRQDSEVA